MGTKKTYFVIILFLTILSINLISAVTLSSGTISSSGLNSTIKITFSLTFDLLTISNNSITFYNLSYVHPSSCGQSSFYSVYNYTNSNQNITLDNLLPSISCVTTASSASNQMGPSPSSSSAISTQSNWQVTLTPGSISVLNFSNPNLGFSPSLSLSEMDISVNQTENTNVFVTQYYNPPSGIPAESSGKVYQYLQISLSNSTDVQQTNLIFKVNKSWISNNNLNPNTISIYKLDNLSNSQWIKIPTNYNKADANFYYYKTSVNSFSYFAIGTSQPATNLGNASNGTQQQPPTTTQKNNLTWVWIVIVATVLIALFLGMKRKKNSYNR